MVQFQRTKRKTTKNVGVRGREKKMRRIGNCGIEEDYFILQRGRDTKTDHICERDEMALKPGRKRGIERESERVRERERETERGETEREREVATKTECETKPKNPLGSKRK